MLCQQKLADRLRAAVRPVSSFTYCNIFTDMMAEAKSCQSAEMQRYQYYGHCRVVLKYFNVKK